MEEEREPETVELIRNIWVEEGQQTTHIIQAVNLCMRSIWVKKRTKTHQCTEHMHTVPVSRVWHPRGSNHA